MDWDGDMVERMMIRDNESGWTERTANIGFLIDNS